MAMTAVLAGLVGCLPINETDGGPDGLLGDGGPGDGALGDGGVGDGGVGDGGPGDAGDAGPAPDLVFDAIEPQFVGGWTPVKVVIAPGAAFTFDEVEFRVAEGPIGGRISLSRDDDFDPASPTVMLLGGWLPGSYTLEAVVAGAVVGSAPFDVTLEWSDPDRGPPLWFEGDTDPGFQFGSTDAFGQPGASGIQNFNVQPRDGNWHAIGLFINFTDARYPDDAATVDAMKQNWMDHMVDGVNVGGEMRSAGAYWSEVSGGALTWTAEVHGPIEVDKTFAEAREDGWGNNLAQVAITKAIEQAGVDFSGADSVVLVQPGWVLDVPMCAPTNGGVEICDGLDNDCDGDIDALDSDIPAPCADPPECGDGVVDAGEECDDGNDENLDGCTKKCEARTEYFPWPQGSINKWGPWTINDGAARNLGFVSMPEDWTALDNNSREVYATLAHELGHNLGLGDEYTPEVPGRNIGGWDMMDWDKFQPHLTLSQRLRLGWVDPDDVFSFNPGDLAETQLELDALEELTPAADRYVGLEVRIADGWNYYVEYRLRQPGQVADFGNPIPQMAPGRVLVTDRQDAAIDTGLARPPLLLAPTFPGSDGPVLDVGQRFRQDDPPAEELRISVNAADADFAEILVQHGTFRPDPSIRPWNPPPWQSPDIEVENAKTLADPDNWRNVPWAGNPNTLIANVSNNGNDDAPGVRVDFYVKNYNAGSAENVPIEFLGFTEVDVPAGATVPARCENCWRPSDIENPHFCIEVRIALYQNPLDPTVIEQTEFNNVAQSNYSKFWSDSASPSRRVGTRVQVANRFDERGVTQIIGHQTGARYRTYLRHRWLRLGGAESIELPVMYEFATDLEAALREQEIIEENFVHLSTQVLPPAGIEEEGTPQIMGGVTTQVNAAFRTQMGDINYREQPTGYRGFINAAGPFGAINEGTVLARVVFDDDQENPRYYVGRVVDGEFNIDTEPGNWTEVQFNYLGAERYAPSTFVLTP